MAETLNLNRCRSKLGLIRSETLARSLQTIPNRIGFNKSVPLLLQVSGKKFQQQKNLFLFEDVSQDLRPMFVGFSIKLLVSSIGGVFTCCKSLNWGPSEAKENKNSYKLNFRHYWTKLSPAISDGTYWPLRKEQGSKGAAPPCKIVGTQHKVRLS